MEIICTSLEYKTYRPLFSERDIAMDVAVVELHTDDGVYTMGLSHRADDPEGMWLADFRLNPGGYVAFSHGEGDRTCNKQIAGPEIVAAIENFCD